MANVKITDLTAAATPLAGTELFETVQGGSSKKVAAADIANSATAVPYASLAGRAYISANSTTDQTGSVKVLHGERDYIIAALRRGRKLRGNIPVKLSTIHGAKGGEADHVMLLTDLSSRFAAEYAANADSIHRMFYVGVTRAKKSLHIVLPKNTNRGFQL